MSIWSHLGLELPPHLSQALVGNKKRGIVVHYNKDKGYGHIRSNAFRDQIFFHVSELPNSNPPELRQCVEFKVAVSNKGFAAKSIKYLTSWTYTDVHEFIAPAVLLEDRTALLDTGEKLNLPSRFTEHFNVGDAVIVQSVLIDRTMPESTWVHDMVRIEDEEDDWEDEKAEDSNDSTDKVEDEQDETSSSEESEAAPKRERGVVTQIKQKVALLETPSRPIHVKMLLSKCTAAPLRIGDEFEFTVITDDDKLHAEDITRLPRGTVPMERPLRGCYFGYVKKEPNETESGRIKITKIADRCEDEIMDSDVSSVDTSLRNDGEMNNGHFSNYDDDTDDDDDDDDDYFTQDSQTGLHSWFPEQPVDKSNVAFLPPTVHGNTTQLAIRDNNCDDFDWCLDLSEPTEGLFNLDTTDDWFSVFTKQPTIMGAIDIGLSPASIDDVTVGSDNDASPEAGWRDGVHSLNTSPIFPFDALQG
eukprot:m.173718 g.173718  ORF g.173718 m.173718 type:complete len:473 (-) comp16533_c13_seq2:2883-4301(-)